MKYLFKAESQEEYEEFVSDMEYDTPYVVTSPDGGVEYYLLRPLF